MWIKATDSLVYRYYFKSSIENITRLAGWVAYQLANAGMLRTFCTMTFQKETRASWKVEMKLTGNISRKTYANIYCWNNIFTFDIAFHTLWDRSRYQNITYMYWRSLAFMIGNISREAVPPNADCWVNNNYYKENRTEVHWRPCAMCLGEVQRIHNCRGRDNCTNAQQSLS